LLPVLAGAGGSFELSWDGDTFVEYQSVTDGCYLMKWYTFGDACASFMEGSVPPDGSCP